MSVASSWQENITPQTTVLIVYDMQAGIASQVPAGREIIRKVGLVLTAARAAGVRIFFTRHLSLPKALMGVWQYRTAMAWQRVDSPEKGRPIFVRDSPAFQIVPELAPRPSEGIVDKIAMSAFEGTFLATALRDCGIRSFIIAGIALEIGIDPTCRQGADLGFWPILVEDACGFGNQEAAEHSIASLRHMGDTSVTNVAAICRLLEQPSSSVYLLLLSRRRRFVQVSNFFP